MVALNLIAVITKRLIMLSVLALAVWHITAMLNSGVPYGKVLVYVSEQPSLLTVDRQRYSITPQMAYPLVCELAPGRHMLRLERNGERIYETAFTVEAQREQTLFAPGRRVPRAQPLDVNANPPLVSAGAVPVRRTAFRDTIPDKPAALTVGN